MWCVVPEAGVRQAARELGPQPGDDERLLDLGEVGGNGLGDADGDGASAGLQAASEVAPSSTAARDAMMLWFMAASSARRNPGLGAMLRRGQ